MHKDFEEFLKLLNYHKAKYVIVGGYALSVHMIPRPKTSEGRSSELRLGRSSVGAGTDRAGLKPGVGSRIRLVAWVGSFWGKAPRRYRSIRTPASRIVPLNSVTAFGRSPVGERRLAPTNSTTAIDR